MELPDVLERRITGVSDAMASLTHRGESHTSLLEIQTVNFAMRSTMTDTTHRIAKRNALVLDPNGAVLEAATLPNDIISLAWEHDTNMVVIKAERLPFAFFQLKTRVLGETAQKLANYRVLLVVLGDVSAHMDASSAFRDFVGETNAGTTLWLLDDMDALERKLNAGP